MTRDQFHNGLRLIRSIDSHEVADADWYPRFAADPFMFFIRCDDDTAAVIWAAMEKRTPTGNHMVPAVRMDQSMGVAAVMVAGLISTFGKPEESEDELATLHLVCLAVFLHQLLSAAKHKDKVVGILNAIIGELQPTDVAP